MVLWYFEWFKWFQGFRTLQRFWRPNSEDLVDCAIDSDSEVIEALNSGEDRRILEAEFRRRGGFWRCNSEVVIQMTVRILKRILKKMDSWAKDSKDIEDSDAKIQKTRRVLLSGFRRHGSIWSHVGFWRKFLICYSEGWRPIQKAKDKSQKIGRILKLEFWKKKFLLNWGIQKALRILEARFRRPGWFWRSNSEDKRGSRVGIQKT